MTTVNPFDGSCYLGPKMAAGFGTLISADMPGTLATMIANGTYYREISPGQDVDTVLVTAGDKYLLSFFRSYLSQRLMQSFVFRSTTIGGQLKIRAVHRQLAVSMTLQEAYRSCGASIDVSDDWSAAIPTVQNQQLAGVFAQIYRAP
jgi:hypothetical protein